MPVEITEQELDSYRKLAGIVQALKANPEANDHFERGLKTVYPTARTAADAREDMLKPLRDEIAAMKAAQEQRDADEAKARKEAEDAAAIRTLEDGFSRLRDREGLQPAGEEKVREIMKDRNIFDPEAAFALFERMNPKPKLEQAAYVPPQWNLEEDLMPDAKAWFTDPDKAEQESIGQVLLEMRRGSGE